MRLEFQMVDEQHIKIIAISDINGKEEGHEVGEIFTPSGSCHNTLNAIQVCGFEEAFEIYGCGNYARPWTKNHVMTDKSKQVKDIQLVYRFETIRKPLTNLNNICHSCFNNPCNCDRKEKYGNPFTVKKEKDLFLYKKEEEKKK